jgi:cell division protein FtsX
MNRITIAAVFAIVAWMAPLATAQATWRNLRFGMTETEAKVVLGADAHRPTKEQQSNDSVAYCGWVVSINVETVPGIAYIEFDRATKRLHNLFLSLQFKTLATDMDKTLSAAAIVTSLENKYGTPFRKDDKDDNEMTQYITWRVQDQVIKYSIIRVQGIPDLIVISYEPPSGIKDL